MAKRDGKISFLYYTDSRSQDTKGPRAWGSGSLINAVDEGLAGIRDLGVRYDEMQFAPRFPVTHYTELRYLTGYEVTGTVVDVRYILKEEGMRYDLYSPARKVTAHILLPEGKTCARLLVDGKDTPFTLSTVGDSRYVDAVVHPADGKLSFEILF